MASACLVVQYLHMYMRSCIVLYLLLQVKPNSVLSPLYEALRYIYPRTCILMNFEHSTTWQ